MGNVNYLQLNIELATMMGVLLKKQYHVNGKVKYFFKKVWRYRWYKFMNA